MKHLHDYIVVFEDVIPQNLCDSILEEFKDESEWKNTEIAGGLDKTVRNAKTIVISYPHVVEKNFKVRQKLDTCIFNSAGSAIKQYNEKFSLCRIQQDSGYELLRYEEGCFYVQHTDSYKENPRAVSCSFALNDDYDGGEFAFFDRELVYRLKKGSCIMFPANFMYPHEIMPVTRGVRYSIITWFI